MMKYLILFFTIYQTSFLIFCQNNCITELKVINDTAYFVNDTALYNGSYDEYYPGQVKVEGNYMNGLKDGIFVYHDYNGKIDSTISYKQGKRNGKKISYFYYGTYKSIENYTNDLKNDSSIYWDRSGQLKRTEIWDNGKLVSYKDFIIDSSIVGYFVSIDCETNGVLKKRLFKKNKTAFLKVMKIQSYDIDTITGNYKTKILNDTDYKILSFHWEGVVPLEKNSVGGIDADFSNNGNVFNEVVFRASFLRYTKLFWLYDIEIVDRNGIRSVLPSRKFEIK